MGRIRLESERHTYGSNEWLCVFLLLPVACKNAAKHNWRTVHTVHCKTKKKGDEGKLQVVTTCTKAGKQN